MELKILDSAGNPIDSYTEELFLPQVRDKILSFAEKAGATSLVLQFAPGKTSAKLYYIGEDGGRKASNTLPNPSAIIKDINYFQKQVSEQGSPLPKKAPELESPAPLLDQNKISISIQGGNIYLSFKGEYADMPPRFVGAVSTLLSNQAVKQMANFIIASMQTMLGERPYELQEVHFTPVRQSALAAVSEITIAPLTTENPVASKLASAPDVWSLEEGRIYHELSYQNVLQKQPEDLPENAVISLNSDVKNIVSILLNTEYPKISDGTIQDLNNLSISVGYQLKEFQDTSSGILTEGSKNFENDSEFVFTPQNGGIDINYLTTNIATTIKTFESKDIPGPTMKAERAPRPSNQPLTEEEVENISKLVKERPLQQAIKATPPVEKIQKPVSEEEKKIKKEKDDQIAKDWEALLEKTAPKSERKIGPVQ